MPLLLVMYDPELVNGWQSSSFPNNFVAGAGFVIGGELGWKFSDALFALPRRCYQQLLLCTPTARAALATRRQQQAQLYHTAFTIVGYVVNRSRIAAHSRAASDSIVDELVAQMHLNDALILAAQQGFSGGQTEDFVLSQALSELQQLTQDDDIVQDQFVQLLALIAANYLDEDNEANTDIAEVANILGMRVLRRAQLRGPYGKPSHFSTAVAALFQIKTSRWERLTYNWTGRRWFISQKRKL